MADPTYQGYARIERNIKRYFRASANPGTVDEWSIADAVWEGERYLSDLIVESGVHWANKSKVIDDTADSFGTQIGYQMHRYFFEQDLGITDIAKVVGLWRTDPDMGQTDQRISYAYTDAGRSTLRDAGSLAGPSGEFYTDEMDENAEGHPEQSIILFNKGHSISGGHLRIAYWLAPPPVEVEWFTEVDSAGNIGRKPPFPPVLWTYIMNYAKWVITEQTGDVDRRVALAQRFGGRTGLTNRLRMWLGTFQSSEPIHVEDTFVD